MSRIIISLTNTIGKLYRDVVVLCSGDFVEYFVKGGYFVYKNILPFNMTMGVYKFLKKDDYFPMKASIKLNKVKIY